MTGEKLKLTLEGETNYVSLGDQKAQVLRSDIALENGVLHVSVSSRARADLADYR